LLPAVPSRVLCRGWFSTLTLASTFVLDLDLLFFAFVVLVGVVWVVASLFTVDALRAIDRHPAITGSPPALGCS
jgi:hypothetical protein